MKKLCCALFGLMLIFSLASCSEENSAKMYINAARLDQQEQDMAELLKSTSETQIYDFSLDDKINSIKIKTYQLTDGRWEIMSENESLEFTDSKGRIALQFEDISNELKVSVQGEHSNSAFSYFGEIKNDNDNMSISTSALTDTEKISYEKEIPLAVQIITSKDEVNSYDPSYFFKPDEYEKYGYEHVYAVTVTFIKGADY